MELAKYLETFIHFDGSLNSKIQNLVYRGPNFVM